MTPTLSAGALAALQAAGDCGVRLQGEREHGKILAIEVFGESRTSEAARVLLRAHRFEVVRFLAAQGATLGSAKLWTAADTAALVASRRYDAA